MINDEVYQVMRELREYLEPLWLNEPEIQRFGGYDDGRRMWGYCAIASYRLAQRLQALGYPAKFVKGKYDCYNHCWVELEDKILDITATQFAIDNPLHVTFVDDCYYDKCTDVELDSEIDGFFREWAWQHPHRILPGEENAHFSVDGHRETTKSYS